MRSMRTLIPTLILVLAAPVFVSAVGAQAPPAEVTDEQRQQAREAYGRGQSEFDAGNFQASEAAFSEAYSLIPNPVVLIGLAEARERQGNIVGTIEALEIYLRDRADAPDRATVEARLADLRARPATLVVSSVPAGASITVDGDDSGQTTPAELSVAPGEHTLSFSAEGREDATEAVTAVPGGRHEIAATLAEAPVEQLDGVGDGIDEAEGEGDGDADEADEGPGAAVWATSAIAAGALVGGTVLGFLALSQEAEFDDEPTEDRADKGERFALFADVLFGVAAVGAITALVLFLSDSADDEDEDEGGTDEATTQLQVAPVVGPRGGGVQARLQF